MSTVVGSDAAERLSLVDIGASTFLFHTCPFLSPCDLLSFRIASKQTHDMLHKEEESEKLWQILLKRDFQMEIADENSTNWKQVLNLKFPMPKVASIFGVDPASDDFWITVHTAFDVWKYWWKLSGRVYSSSTHHHDCVMAPYFIRAARFWQQIFQWCDDPSQSKSFGNRLRKSFRTGYEDFQKTLRQLTPLQRNPCHQSILAVYAFTSGQGSQFIHGQSFDGLLGGYHAYGYYSSTSLVSPHMMLVDGKRQMVRVACDLLSEQQGLSKTIQVDSQTGAVYLKTEIGLQRAVHPHESPQSDDFLTWLEEYARRVTTREYAVNFLATQSREPTSIVLFPEEGSSMPTIDTTTSSEALIPAVSRSVTRGVQVVASAVYAPQGRSRFGYIYCIRIRLLTPGEDGYQSESERGFSTCQLQSRHWRITDDATGRVDAVDGEGVIGMYPILHEGRYTEGRASQQSDGTFQYQSCTGAIDRGSFGGHIRFVPGNLMIPTGEPFNVSLNPFVLVKEPEFLY